MNKRFLFCILLFAIGLSVVAQLPAFPGAEGHGRFTSGGRGGEIYYVTSLEDTDTKGTFRYAVNSSTRFKKPLTVLFRISGTIHLKSTFEIKTSNLTIAGQSAPGDGICLRGYPVTVKANNVIIRYLRFRMGDAETISASGADAFGMRDYSNLMVDHCSMSWCTDECVSIYGNKNTTLQWCLISESLRLSKHDKGAHGYGGIWGGQKASFLYNLMAHHDSRNPRLGPSAQSTPTNEQVDMRNNVIYNMSGNSTYGAEAMHVNIVNNYYKPGPASATGSKRGRIISIDKKTDNSMPVINNLWGTFFIDGNVVDDGKNDINCNRATTDNWTYGVYNQFSAGYGTVSEADKVAMRLSSPLDSEAALTFSARTAFDRVLAHAGASLSRDLLDLRIVSETLAGTASFKGKSATNSGGYPKPGIIDSQDDLRPEGADESWSAWPQLNTVGTITDTDGDGMPDSWETAHGLNPSSAADGNLTTLDGQYTNLEVYLNERVDLITTAQYLGFIPAKLNNPRESHAAQVRCLVEHHTLTVQAAAPMNALAVYSLDGTLVRQALPTDRSFRLDIASFPSGCYIVEVRFLDSTTAKSRFLR